MTGKSYKQVLLYYYIIILFVYYYQRRCKIAVASQHKKRIGDYGKQLESFFEMKNINFLPDAGMTILQKKIAVLFKDMPALIDFVCQKRQVGSYLVKIGISGGGGSFKIYLNIID